MAKGLKNLSSREYPGRVIIIGQDPSGENVVVIYAITGRSPSSQSRKLVLKEDAIQAVPADEKTLQKGNTDLLVYPAILFSSLGIAVSNGRQTPDIGSALRKTRNPEEVLSLALGEWDYEPDSPIFTPRISGCVLPGGKAALSMIRRGPDSSTQREYYKIPLKAGAGSLIATYSGENRDPVPSFTEKPAAVKIQTKCADEMAESVYESLGPAPGKSDFRVSVASVYSSDMTAGYNEIYIINRNERIKS